MLPLQSTPSWSSLDSHRHSNDNSEKMILIIRTVLLPFSEVNLGNPVPENNWRH